MHPTLSPLPAIGRVLLAMIFVLAGIGKLSAIGATSAHMASAGIPYSNDLVWGAVALELGGGILLIVGLLTRFVGLALFFYTLTLALLFHAYWTMTGAAAHEQHSAFFEHMSMMGGMLYVVAYGAGPYSIDAMIRGRHSDAAALRAPYPQPAE